MDNSDFINQLRKENELLKNQLQELRDLEHQHKLSEEELKNTTARLRKIFDAAPDAILILDAIGTFIHINKIVENILGCNRRDIVGKNFFEITLLNTTYQNKVKEGIQKSLMGEKYGPVEVSYKSRTGEYVHSELLTYPIKFDERSLILMVVHDVTLQKRNARIILENEQRLSLHINQTPLGVIEWDLNFTVKRWNPAAERIFGYSKKEVLGKSVKCILSPDIYEKVKVLWEEILISDSGRKHINENITKSGETILCEWFNTRLVNKFNQVVAVASWVQDITERVRTERIKKVLYDISNAVNTTDNLHKLIGFIQTELSTIIDTTNFYIALYNESNDTFTLPFFVDEKDQFTEIPAGKTLTKYVVKKQKPFLANTRLMSELEQQGEIESVGADSKIWLGVPLKTEGRVTGVLVVQSYTDENAFNSSDVQMLEFVSDQISISINRKKTEDELVNALKKAEESDKLKTAFLQNMSHEIRTPMSGILGFTTLLKESGKISDRQLEYLRIIEKSGERMLNTINDLMDISKVEAGQMDVENREVNVNELINYIQTFFYPEAKQKGLDISCKKGLEDSSSTIISDREKLYAILTNLVKNAIKYTEKGSVSFGYVAKGNYLEFFVKDNGIGIPKQELDTIFDRFVQVHHNLSSKYEGTGLGLSITKAYVEMLGGEIHVESESGKGSQFYFKIPVKKGEKIEIKAEQKSDEKQQKSDEKQQLKILIAEDDETIRKYLSIVVRKISSGLLFAKNGIEAVEISKNNPDIDLILMDIKMPGMDGYEATKKIREFNKNVIIVAQTAFAFESEQEKAETAGCNDYISKPINRNSLINIIGKYFNS
jgi:PAS domain S-box-containing protein